MILFLLLASTLLHVSLATPPTGLPYKGVNLAGAENGLDMWAVSTSGTYKNWWPSPQYGYTGASYYLGKGMTLFRVPFRWERLQPVKGQALDYTELTRMKTTINNLLATGLNTVVLDMHNYGRYSQPGGSRTNKYAIVGESGYVTIEHFADAWSRIAKEFKSDMRVVFGLTNEPHDQNMTIYYKAIQAAVTSIRDTGATNYLAMMGGDFGAAQWYSVKESEADAMLASVTDPLGNLMFEAHIYMDDAGGSSGVCNGNVVGRTKCGMFTDWLRKHNRVGMIGEFSAPSGSTCQDAIRNLLNHMESNSDLYFGWSYWAAGPPYVLSLTNIVSLEPILNSDKEQMNTLEPHILWKKGNPVTDIVQIPNGCLATQYGKCAGLPGGPTCCPTGYWCRYTNDYWSDCRIGSNPNGAVTKMVLYDMNNGGGKIVVRDPLENGAVINLNSLSTGKITIQAVTMPSVVGSVKFTSGANYNIESTAPYAMTPITITSAGTFSVTATPYVWAGGGGTAGSLLKRSFTVVTSTPVPTPTSTPVAAVTSMMLWDLGVNPKVAIQNPLSSGTISLRDLSTGLVGIEATVGSAGAIGSVKFSSELGTNVDDWSTYDMTSYTLTAAGTYTVVATPYRAASASGDAGTALSRSLTFVTVQVNSGIMAIVPYASVASFTTLVAKYTRFDAPKTWADASAYCVSRGGKLAMPKTSADYATMKRYLPAASTNAWIGVQKVAGVLKFVDGTSVTTTYWSSGEGSITTEMCVSAVTSGANEKNYGRWIDTSCTSTRYFICQK